VNTQKIRHSSTYNLPEHYRPRQFSTVWQSPLPNWQDRLKEAIERIPGNHTPNVFFRADDIGAGSCAFEALCNLFRHYETPLAMSVVPAWLSDVRQRRLFECAPLEEALWGWHQHGWRHVNWQRTGKKSEFGEHRPLEKQWRDIWQGREKMLRVFEGHLLPVFTPPWNRLAGSTVKILQQLGFRAVSTTKPLPRVVKTPAGFKNLRIQLDLHTRKAADASTDYQNLVAELASLLARKEPSGIVIHHQRMTAFAFEFIDELLRLLKRKSDVTFLSFQEILDSGNGF
jgi:peptidoglycan/xylan/chitin deacetylase (PgdA/CDA1 family)